MKSKLICKPAPNYKELIVLTICENCVFHPWLLSELKHHGNMQGQCNSCDSRDVLALPVSDDHLRNIFRILLRISFSQWHYHRPMGGKDLSEIILENREKFGLSGFPDEKIAIFSEQVDDSTWENPRELIPIRAPHGDVLSSLRMQGESALSGLIGDCQVKNSFKLIREFKDLIDGLKYLISDDLPAGTKYYRARIGFAKVDCGPSFAYGERPVPLYLGFTGKEISAPRIGIASEGRLNRAKNSVLYVSTNRHTALCEVRPHPGHIVTIGEFITQRNLKVANFSYPSIDRILLDGKLEELAKTVVLGDLLNAPVPPEQKDLYLATQIIGDAVRESGFDAIEFKSSVADGVNLVFFDGDDCQFVPDSETIERVNQVVYYSTEVLRLNQENQMHYHVE